jgi:lipopolysaccharide transport system ATP-binding protein
MSDPRIVVRGLSKRYRRGPEHSPHTGMGATLLRPYRRLRGLPVAAPQAPPSEFWALQDVTFDVYDGERIGIIGRNGAGKSTLLKILSRIIYPTEGEARICGRVTSLLEVGTGFNQGLSGRENIYLNASVHGLERKEIDARFEDIVEFSGIREFIDTPVKHYSSGMYMRLAFSVAAHLDPDILLLDEVLAVGDLSFQQKCLKRVEGLTAEGRTVLFVSHSMDAITRFCSRCIWLERGRIRLDGAVREVIDDYVSEMLEVTSSKKWVDAAQPEAGLAPRHPQDQPPAVSGAAQSTNEACAAALDAAEVPGAVTGSRTAVAAGGGNGRSVLVETAQVAAPAETAAAAASAPGNEHVRLISARAINADRRSVVSINVNEPIGIEMVYDILKDEKLLLPAFRFYSASDVHLFSAVYTDPEYMQTIKPVGRYVSTAWIPGNLLNTGVVYVTLAISTPGPALERHVVLERAIAFNVVDVFEIESTARGLYTRNFPGAVRPLLKWETRRVQ